MKLLKFLVSKTFFISLLKAVGIGIGLIFLLFAILRIHTRQNRLIAVPDLYQMPLEQAQVLLKDLRLGFEVIDSTQFNPEFPPLSVIEQQPRASEQVKRKRKVYVTLNPATYRNVSIPKVVQVTYRNAASSLRAVGLDVGKITYRNNIGKDMVLELRVNGKKVIPGEKQPKTTKIDLVLGNGRRAR